MADGSHHVFCYNEEALGRNNIKLMVVEENDSLNFVRDTDVVISRTMNRRLISTIKGRNAKNTAESYLQYELVKDKASLSDFLKKHKVLVPNKYSISEVENGKTYFVKPRFGYDSFGISTECICKSKEEVAKCVSNIEAQFNQDSIIEDFVDGEECTVACVNNGTIGAYAVKIDCSKTGGILTRGSKENYEEYCSPLRDDKLAKIAINVFTLLGLKHHARMDLRRDGKDDYYLIDINLLPGLGPIDHFAKCLLLSGNLSYIDAMKSIVNSASKD